MCATALTRTKSEAEEAAATAARCEGEVTHLGTELEYAVSDSELRMLEGSIQRSGAARRWAAALVAAVLIFGILLALLRTAKRMIVTLHLEREKLLLDKLEAETLHRGRTPSAAWLRQDSLRPAQPASS